MKIGDLVKYRWSNEVGLVVAIHPADGTVPEQVLVYYGFYDPPQIINFDLETVELIFE